MKIVFLTAFCLLMNILAFAGPMVSGGVGDSRILVCEVKRGLYYSHFTISKTSNPNRFVGEYSDRTNTPGVDFVKLSCTVSYKQPMTFSCAEQRPGERQILAETSTSTKGTQVEIGHNGYNGTFDSIDQISCDL